jgi:signal transduction histidine kinase
MSHELRTPLTSIRGALGLVAGGVAGALPEKAAQFVKIACHNADRLTRVVNDVLDAQMIESGKMILDLASHALAPLIERAVAENRGYAEECRVGVTIELPLPTVAARVDAPRMVQVVRNLLSNATKFSPSEGSVEVGMIVADGAVRISVTDHGRGILTSFQQRIFSTFSQADSSDRRQKGGTGLGLTIAKALIECMGGKIGYRTDAGIATTFYVELPVDGD